ncbi:hypothetical protein OSSY52_18350 [Tepiditoga spiralis]|uniref:Epoxyqueuosine reductase QueH n=1 Tax=Tepiditoga spiralis TaxID=2108365 RepID=A0A7G1G8X4_9BACT|nr:epoxyqueuosine reductase QueH [Tepiditoga spiralis]BBE31694.1 hypothetical protein OSSY52_18350 [Tepiditoga spiralis]
MKIFLHVCCAPDLTISYKRLIELGYTPTTYFYNPNIHPKSEYEKRLNAYYQLKEIWNFKEIKAEYNIKKFFDNLDLNKRCESCIEHRIIQTAKIAQKNGFKQFTTTLLASPRKSHEMIIKCGKKAEKLYNIEFKYFNFRENSGISKAAKMCRTLNIYRQNYCGCSYSIFEAKQITKKSKEQKFNELKHLIGEEKAKQLFYLFKKDILKVPEDLSYIYLKKYGLKLIKLLKPRIILMKKEIANELNINKSGRKKVNGWRGKFIIW